MKLAAIVLTLNEARHLPRCLARLDGVADQVLVADCFSTDRTLAIAQALIDDNLSSLTWWTEKHNRYASGEAVGLLNLEYGFMPRDSATRSMRFAPHRILQRCAVTGLSG